METKVKIKDLLFALVLGVLLFTWTVIGVAFWTRIDANERRLDRLEAAARPLVIVDRFSEVYINGERPEAQGAGGPAVAEALAGTHGQRITENGER